MRNFLRFSDHFSVIAPLHYLDEEDHGSSEEIHGSLSVDEHHDFSGEAHGTVDDHYGSSEEANGSGSDHHGSGGKDHGSYGEHAPNEKKPISH